VRRTVPPSAEIEGQIDRLLAVGVGENPRESLSELARLGARLIIQRAVEDEFDAWLGRARYERRPDYQRGLSNYGSGLRNGFRARKLQTAEGELELEHPAGARGRRAVRVEAVRARDEAAADRAAAGDGDRRVRARAVDTATSSRCASRPGSASSRSQPHHGSASSCASALSSSGAAISTASAWRRCSSTRSFSRSDPTGPRRACSSRGASPRTASACCSR
jgi:mutator family transposase